MEDSSYKIEDFQPIGGYYSKVEDVVFLVFIILLLGQHIHVFSLLLDTLNKSVVKLKFSPFTSNLFSIVAFVILVFAVYFVIGGVINLYSKMISRSMKTLKLVIINGEEDEYKKSKKISEFMNNKKSKDREIEVFENKEIKIFEFVLKEKEFHKFFTIKKWKFNIFLNSYEFSERRILRLLSSQSWESKPLEQFLKDNFKGFKYFLTLSDPFLLVLSLREVFYISLIGLFACKYASSSNKDYFFVLAVLLEFFFIFSLLEKIYIVENRLKRMFYFLDYIYFYVASKSFDAYFDEEFLELLNRYKEKIVNGRFFFYEIIKLVFDIN